jgi:hypothetical protein
MPKQFIEINDDNFHDYLKMDFGKRLVRTATAADRPFDRDSPYVVRFRQWVIGQSLASRRYDFDVSRHDAAVILDLLAEAVDDERAGTRAVRSARRTPAPPARHPVERRRGNR